MELQQQMLIGTTKQWEKKKQHTMHCKCTPFIATSSGNQIALWFIGNDLVDIW